ncbi:hypothetical protein [Maribacter sp. MAR_2009_72]|uniref:hypothetical protein n=1 Tax=Maribacter sp. MAR_2009_72 TaxID=1250050 RepID=UPI00119C08FD|nr:hypothetical protein [Maribacter sp. MAR_2009_72]TVZ16489.1 hypothetical protein JM81_2750 [Maribacter sp. MAR_2009_72]
MAQVSCSYTARSLTLAITDCPDGEMVVLPKTKVNYIKNSLGVSYYTEEFYWISNSNNIEEVAALNNFVLANTVNGVLDPFVKEFALKALEDLQESVTWTTLNQIIKENFKNY